MYEQLIPWGTVFLTFATIFVITMSVMTFCKWLAGEENNPGRITQFFTSRTVAVSLTLSLLGTLIALTAISSGIPEKAKNNVYAKYPGIVSITSLNSDDDSASQWVRGEKQAVIKEVTLRDNTTYMVQYYVDSYAEPFLKSMPTYTIPSQLSAIITEKQPYSYSENVRVKHYQTLYIPSFYVLLISIPLSLLIFVVVLLLNVYASHRKGEHLYSDALLSACLGVLLGILIQVAASSTVVDRVEQNIHIKYGDDLSSITIPGNTNSDTWLKGSDTLIIASWKDNDYYLVYSPAEHNEPSLRAVQGVSDSLNRTLSQQDINELRYK